MDYYDGYHFFVLHAVNQKTLKPEEVDMFVGKNYITSIFMPLTFIVGIYGMNFDFHLGFVLVQYQEITREK